MALPEANPRQPNDGGPVVLGQCNAEAAAVAIDAATEANLLTGILGNDMAAIAERLEVGRPRCDI